MQSEILTAIPLSSMPFHSKLSPDFPQDTGVRPRHECLPAKESSLHVIPRTNLALQRRHSYAPLWESMPEDRMLVFTCASIAATKQPLIKSPNSLPVEILQLIFQYIIMSTYDMAERDRSLQNVRGTCPHWQRVVDAMIFRGRHMQWYWNPKTNRLHVK